MATPEVLDEFFRRSAEYVQNNREQIKQLVNAQRSREIEIINQTSSFCPIEQIQNRTVRAEDIERALREGYDDGNILRALMCLNNSMVVFPDSAETGRSFKVRDYIQKLRQIGGESAEGYVMLADVKSIQNQNPGRSLFVVKSPRRIDEQLRVNQIHEYFVGAFGTNKLRSRIPNFSYVLGLFQCSPPYIEAQSYLQSDDNSNTRPALTYCQNDVTSNQVNYLLYENVANSVTFRQFIINGCSFGEYMNVLTQIVLAINEAYLEVDFTHYDLHDENILVRTLPEEIYIPYRVDSTGSVRYLRTRYVATIIDLGRSHIKYEGQDFGYALIEASLYPDRAYPMYDIYKILLFSLNSAAFGDRSMRNFAGLRDNQFVPANRPVFDNAKELISYFVPDMERDNVTQYLITASDYLIRTRKYYYSLPYSNQLDISPVRFFQDAMMVALPDVINRFMIDQPDRMDKVYGCANKGTCRNLEDAIMDYSQPNLVYIDDPYTFYETMVKLREGLQSDITVETLLHEGQNRYFQYMNKLRSDRNRYSEEYNRLIQNYTVVSLRDGAPDSVKFQNAFLDAYREFIAKSVRMVDILTSIAHIEIIIRTINELFPNLARQQVPETNYRYIDIPEVEFMSIRRSVVQMNEVISSIKRDVAYISTLNERQILNRNYGAIWLFQKMPSLVAAIMEL